MATTLAISPYPAKLPAAGLALLVHLLFFALLVAGISWQKTEPPGVSADLWLDLPPAPQPMPAPPPPAVAPAPPPPAPPPRTEAPKPDIALKEKPKPEKPQPVEKPATKPVPDRQAEAQREQELQALLAKQAERFRQQEQQAEQARQAAQLAAAQQSAIGEHIERIRERIRSRLHRTACGSGNPQLEFDIALLPTGQLRGAPVLRKSSGIAACDAAVESAILQAEPLPVPREPELFAHFRELRLKFKPND